MDRWGRAALAVCSALAVAVPGAVALPGPAVPTAQAVAAAVRLSATALVMSGTNQTLSIPPATPDFIRDFVDNEYRTYIAGTGLCGSGPLDCTRVAVYGPEQLWPFTGLTDLTLDESVAAGAANLDACIRGIACMVTGPPYLDTDVSALTDTSYVVKGGSQSAIIGGVEKARLIADPVPGTTVSFVLTSSPNRPNGGLFARFPGVSVLGITFNGATPTNSSRTAPLTTVDIARQYDGWDDFPTNPLNLLADVNALLGAAFLHSQPLFTDGPGLLQGYYQDTTYYLAPTNVLPLLVPLTWIPAIGMPLAKLLDAPLRVLVETGYDRVTNPGQPTAARWLYVPNPLKTVVNLAVAIPTGWDDAIAEITGNPDDRPFHTTPAPPYGVGGPPVYAGAVDPYGPVEPEPQPQPTAASSAVARPAAVDLIPAEQPSADFGPEPSALDVRPHRSSAHGLESSTAPDSSSAHRTDHPGRSRR